jgi:DNA-binding NtrC family response regulator
MATIICLDDDALACAAVERTLTRLGHRALPANTVPEALRALSDEVDLIIADYGLPAMNGLEFLELLRREGHTLPLIMLTGQMRIELAVQAVKAGASDYLTKPFEQSQLQLAIDRVLDAERLKRENEALRREALAQRAQREVIGDAPAMRKLMATVALIAPTRSAVLLQGESGTGKELLARAVHDLSDRSAGPFVALNCAALPSGLVESVLFGHEKGAFTGAMRRVPGAFERAHGGTLLLDEISEMPLDLQAKLLRVLQEQEFERVGGTAPIRVDVRVVATTNRNLSLEVTEGRFRHDLYYRLNALTIAVPPLRERAGDVALLAHRFAARAAADLGKPAALFAPDAIDALERYDWPGNVRELAHAIERAVLLSGDAVIRATSFDQLHPTKLARTESPLDRQAVEPSSALLPSESLDLAEIETAAIARALQLTGQNRSRAAKLLGIDVRTLRKKLNGHSRADRTSTPASD